MKRKDSDPPIRQLIKFSNYSLCITLPKEYVDNLDWHQGDRIIFELAKEQNNLIMKKEIAQDTTNDLAAIELPPASSIPKSDDSESPDNISREDLSNLEPIPQIN
ncbi:MAG: hypothetical protein Q7S37_05320 [bacterium]|nr:hypothetical protein [bacterium]